MAFLQINNLTKRYGKQTILDKINLSTEEGDFVVLLGPSGCGKSTLLNCVAGLLKYEEGSVFIKDQNMNEVHPSERDIAMVFQSYALYPNMSVKSNISFGMRIRKVPSDEIEKKVAEVSKILNIKELLDRKPSELSGGQQQRVAIGRALVRSPRLFLFDEPLSNLDAKLRVAMRTEIKKLHRRLKTTIIYVTHDQVEAMSLADKIAVMDKGSIIQFDSPEEIYFRPNSTFVAEFIGSPPMNMLPAQIVKKDNDFSLTLNNHGQSVTFSIPTKGWSSNQIDRLERYCQENQSLIMGIRPENIHSLDGLSEAMRGYKISLNVDLIEPNGADNLVVANFNQQELIARYHSDIPLPRVDSQADFFFDLSRCLFYSTVDGKLIV